jgi:Methyltransferase domain
MALPSVTEGRRLIDLGDYDFLAQFVHGVPGWLEDYAAIRTMDLLAYQEREGITGSLLEIGVFHGRYFALMLRSAVRTGEHIVGLDTFQYLDVPAVRQVLAPLADPASVTLLRQFSTDSTADQLAAILGPKARFISIDGSHEVNDVVWDLRLAEQLLAARGIVAVDDFLNPITLGVNDGVHRFFAQQRNVVPFAYTANKLFLCRPGAAAAYKAEFERVVVADEREPRSAAFRVNLPDYRANVEQKLWGSVLLVVP